MKKHGIGLRMVRVGLAGIIFLLLGACSSDKAPDVVDQPVEVLYNYALDVLQNGNPLEAARYFDAVERQHPYSKWAVQAQLLSGYSYYLVSKYDDAVLALDRYIDLHPGNRNVAYAYYLKALCYYEQVEAVTRDQGNTEAAREALTEVIARFPNTSYSRDATLKLDLTRDHLAGKEMDVGRFYLRRDQYLAAINRFRAVVENYQTTTHVAEALHRLVEAYLAVGIVKEAQAAAAVLGHNYPGSDWYQDTYALMTGNALEPAASDESWLSKLF